MTSGNGALAEYSEAFKSAMRVAVANVQSAGHDPTVKLDALINAQLGQKRTEREVFRRLLFSGSSTSRISPQLVNFGRKLANHLDVLGFQSDADAIRRAGVAYVAAASKAAVDRFLSVPDEGMRDLYFDSPRGSLDLTQFTVFSDDEDDISAMHPDLFGGKRHALYKSWYERSPSAFLTLYRVGKRGRHDPIAVSIILPLSADVKGRISHKNWSLDDVVGSIDPSPLPPVVLLDTWIVKRTRKAEKPGEKGRREQHRRWAMVMIGHHLAKFVKRSHPVSVMVEPDFWHIMALCDLFGFTARRGDNLWELDIPSRRPAVDERFFNFVEASAQAGR